MENDVNPAKQWHHRGRIGRWLFTVVVLVLLVIWLFGQQLYLAMATKGYQAVFLANGQVYFGKLSSSGGYMKLTDIYYLQVTQALQQAATSDQTKNANPSTTTGSNTTPNIQLIKLGSELHGPDDAMYIPRSQVLFWENMKNDSKVVSAINQYKSK